MAKKLWSIFTDDMDTCIISGRTDNIERHHIFGGRLGLKTKSEAYGFIIPLNAEYHFNGAQCKLENWKEYDHKFKRACQEYYEENLGTREDWYREFGKFYDWEDIENETED